MKKYPLIKLPVVIILLSVVTSVNVVSQKLAQSFTKGNLVVVRIGDGATPLSNIQAHPVFLDEFTPSGVLVQSIRIPAAGVDKLVLAGNQTHGFSNLSPNGDYIALIGYNAEVGESYDIISQPNVPISASVISENDVKTVTIGNVDLIDPRAAVTNSGEEVWFGGQKSGVNYFKFGSKNPIRISPQIIGAVRNIQIDNGKLYISTSNPPAYIAKIGYDLPITQQLMYTSIIPNNGNSIYLAYGFVFFDVNPSIPGPDLLYFNCDQGSGYLRKFIFNGSKWNEVGNGLAGDAYRNTALIGTMIGGKPVLYASRNFRITKIVDNANPYQPLNVTTTTLLNAPAQTVFRGLTFAPQKIASSVNSIMNEPLDVLVRDRKIIFNANFDELVSIYDVSGQLIKSDKTIDGINTIEFHKKGFFIVKVKNRVSKIIIH